MLPQYKRRKAALISAGIVVLLDIVVIFFDLARFKTNDDIGIMFRVMGEWIVSDATPFTMFSHIDVSRLLVNLFSWSTEIPWYGFYLLLPINLAHYLIFYYGLRNHGNRAFFYLISYLLAGGYFLFIELQFTIAASAWTVSGLILMIQQIRKNRWVWPTWLGVLFTVIGLLVRFNQAVVVIACFLPLMVFFSLNYRQQSRIQRGSILVLSVLLLTVLVQYRHVNAYSSLPHWEDALSFNRLRADMHDFKALEALTEREQESVLNEIGWTRNDYGLFMRHFFWDAELFSLEKLETISERAPIKRKEVGVNFVFNSVLNFFNPYSFAVLFICILLYIESRRMKREHWILFYGIGAIAALYILSAIILKPIPERVSFGLFLALLGSSMVFMRPRPRNQIKLRPWIPVVLLVAISVLNFIEASRKHNKAIRERMALIEYNKFMNEHSNSVAVIWGARFPWKGITPFMKDIVPAGDALLLGSLQQLYSSREHARGLNLIDLSNALITREVFITARSEDFEFEVQLLKNLYTERLGIDTEWNAELIYGQYFLLRAEVLDLPE